jgi:putative transposase
MMVRVLFSQYRQLLSLNRYFDKKISYYDSLSDDQTCSVCKDLPSKDNARKANRKHRGLYVCKDYETVMNADLNGASNIAKKYLDTFCDQPQDRPVVGLGRPRMYRFNGSRFVA